MSRPHDPNRPNDPNQRQTEQTGGDFNVAQKLGAIRDRLRNSGTGLNREQCSNLADEVEQLMNYQRSGTGKADWERQQQR